MNTLDNTRRGAISAAGPLKVVFVLSAMRSGSTWFSLVLGSHSWAANVGEFYRPFRFPGHVACRLCEADGRAECVRLNGIETVEPAAAFHFAAERLDRGLIIDASKDVAWCEQFLGRGDLRPYFIHLVRHPCGYMESERRRDAAKSWQRLFGEWCRANARIERFVAKYPAVPSMLAGYDDLADDPLRCLPEVCAFLGHPFEAPALRYWEFEHHGLGANGAASLYLQNRAVQNFATGDDAFYAERAASEAGADRRWTEVIPAAVRDRCLEHAYVRRLRRQLSAAATWDGGRAAGGTPRARSPREGIGAERLG